MKKKILLKLVYYVHLVVLLYNLLGWIIPGPIALICFLSSQVITILQWKFNQGTCILTNIENYINGVPWPERGAQEGDFISGLIKKILKIEPTPIQLEWVIYGIMVSLFTLDIVIFLLWESDIIVL